MKTKIDIVLELVRQGKVTNEEAKILMASEKEIVTVKEYIPYASPTFPYIWPTVTYGSNSLVTTDCASTTTYMQYPSTYTAN